MFGFLCMCALLGLMPTSGENFMSIARLEICFLREMLTCSILIFPIVGIEQCLTYLEACTLLYSGQALEKKKVSKK